MLIVVVEMEATLRTPTVVLMMVVAFRYAFRPPQQAILRHRYLIHGLLDFLFVHANIIATENLYTLGGNWPCLGPDTLLSDVCYVTGRIDASLLDRVGMVTCSHHFQKSFNSRF